MRHILSTPLAAALLAATCAVAPASFAAELRVAGEITAVQLAPDGKSATVTVRPAGGAEVALRITDDDTLGKLKDSRIGVGDDVRASYDDTGGRNLSKVLKKKAGC